MKLAAKLYHWVLPIGSYPGIVLVSVACLFSCGVITRARPQLHELEILYAPLLFGVGLFFVVLWRAGSNCRIG